MAGRGTRASRFVGPFTPRRESDALGGLDHAHQVGADAVGAGEGPHLLQADRHPVMKRDGRQRRGTAITLVVLPDERKLKEIIESHIKRVRVC